jgi:hypothetical protein
MRKLRQSHRQREVRAWAGQCTVVERPGRRSVRRWCWAEVTVVASDGITIESGRGNTNERLPRGARCVCRVFCCKHTQSSRVRCTHEISFGDIQLGGTCLVNHFCPPPVIYTFSDPIRRVARCWSPAAAVKPTSPPSITFINLESVCLHWSSLGRYATGLPP